MFKRFLKSLALCLITYLGYGQQDTVSVLPGSPLIDGSIIEDYTNKWTVSPVTGDGQEKPNRIWTDYGQIIEIEGKTYFHRVQDLYDPKMNLQETWINMVEHESLIPVSFSRTTPSGKFEFYQFEDKKITRKTNFLEEGFEPKSFQAEVRQNIYDWNLYGMLLVGLPFEVGLVIRLPIYSEQTNDQSWLVVRVDGKEMIPAHSGQSINAWKLTADKNLTFWLTQKAPYVHRLELSLENNSKLIWKTF